MSANRRPHIVGRWISVLSLCSGDSGQGACPGLHSERRSDSVNLGAPESGAHVRAQNKREVVARAEQPKVMSNMPHDSQLLCQAFCHVETGAQRQDEAEQLVAAL